MPYKWHPIQLTYQNVCQVSFDPAGNILVVDHALSKENTAALYRKSHLCIPGKGTARHQSQFLHSCVCERFIYSQDWFTYFGCSKLDRSILERGDRTLYFCFGNKEAAQCTVSFQGIHKREPDIYLGFSPAFHLQCAYVQDNIYLTTVLLDKGISSTIAYRQLGGKTL